MQCTHCGSDVPEGATVCPACGAKAAPAADPGAGMFKRPGDIGADGYTLSDEPVSPVYQPAATPHCPTCGAPLSAGDKFCTACGAPSPLASDDAAKRLGDSGVRVNIGSHRTGGGSTGSAAPTDAASEPSKPAETHMPAETHVPPAPPEPPVDIPSDYPAPSSEPYGSYEPPADSFLGGLCASPLYLLTMLLCSVMAVFRTINVFKTTLPALSDLEGEAQVFSLITLVYFIVPMVCWVLGLWMLFAAAKSTSGSLSVSGLTVIKVAAFVSLAIEVLAALYGLFKLIESGFFEALGYLDYLPGDLQVALIGTLLGITLFLVLNIILDIKVITMTSGTAHAISYGAVSPIPSAYVGTMMFLAALLILLLPFLLAFLMSALANIMYASYGISTSFSEMLDEMFSSMDVLSLLQWLANAVAYFLLGVLTFSARSKWQSQISY